jgi:hypothetical protein
MSLSAAASARSRLQAFEITILYENRLRPKDWLADSGFVVDLGRTEYDPQTKEGAGDDYRAIQEDL